MYRKMRKITKSHWRDHRPKTNVYWLHYLLDKSLEQFEVGKFSTRSPSCPAAVFNTLSSCNAINTCPTSCTPLLHPALETMSCPLHPTHSTSILSIPAPETTANRHRPAQPSAAPQYTNEPRGEEALREAVQACRSRIQRLGSAQRVLRDPLFDGEVIADDEA